MKLGWLTDIHLNFLEESGLSTFLRTLASSPVDAWLVGGDIGEADSVVGFLREMEASTEVPIYFVLGNHGFYGESLAVVEAEIEQLSERSQNLIWLTSVGSQSLNPTVALVGDDSWADARLGDASRTQVEVNDFYLITEGYG